MTDHRMLELLAIDCHRVGSTWDSFCANTAKGYGRQNHTTVADTVAWSTACCPWWSVVTRPGNGP